MSSQRYQRRLVRLLHRCRAEIRELRLLPGIAVDPRRRTKFSLAPAAEQRLTNWMTTHLQVTLMLHPVPEDLEKDIVKELTPPLNYDYAAKGRSYAKPLQIHRLCMNRQCIAFGTARHHSHPEPAIAIGAPTVPTRTGPVTIIAGLASVRATDRAWGKSISVEQAVFIAFHAPLIPAVSSWTHKIGSHEPRIPL